MPQETRRRERWGQEGSADGDSVALVVSEHDLRIILLAVLAAHPHLVWVGVSPLSEVVSAHVGLESL